MTVVLGLLLQQFVVYSAVLLAVARRSPAAFFRRCREVYVYAFSTASSNTTLPLSLEVAERQLGLSPRIARFVLTVGSTANQNGTALFEGVTVLFLAQVYGPDLAFGQQIRVMLMSIVAGINDADHQRCRAALEDARYRLVIPALVVAEATYLIGTRLGAEIEARFLRSLAAMDVEAPAPDDWPRIADLVLQHRDFPLGAADASVVALAERLAAETVVTLDERHFRAVRPKHRRAFRIVP